MLVRNQGRGPAARILDSAEQPLSYARHSSGTFLPSNATLNAEMSAEVSIRVRTLAGRLVRGC